MYDLYKYHKFLMELILNRENQWLKLVKINILLNPHRTKK